MVEFIKDYFSTVVKVVTFEKCAYNSFWGGFMALMVFLIIIGTCIGMVAAFINGKIPEGTGIFFSGIFATFINVMIISSLIEGCLCLKINPTSIKSNQIIPAPVSL